MFSSRFAKLGLLFASLFLVAAGGTGTGESIGITRSGGSSGSGTVTSVNGTAPIVSDGSTTTPTLSCTSAGTATAGCLTAGAQNIDGAKTFLSSGTFSAGLSSTTGSFSGTITSTVPSGSQAYNQLAGAKLCLESTCVTELDATTSQINASKTVVTAVGQKFTAQNGAGQLSSLDGAISASGGGTTWNFPNTSTNGMFPLIGSRPGTGTGNPLVGIRNQRGDALVQADSVIKIWKDDQTTLSFDVRADGTVISPVLQLTSVASGTGYTTNYNGANVSGTLSITIAKAAWTAAALTQDITIGTIPAKSRIMAVYADTTAAYAGLAGTIQLQMGTSSGGNQLILIHDVKTATVTKGLVAADMGASMQMTGNVQVGVAPSWSTQQVFVRLTSGSGNIGTGAATNLTTGSTTYYITIEALP